jgi:DNA-binding beta-propeller fold protein YncE
VQKFTPDGKFIKMWGYFGQGEKPEAFWGPRGIVVDEKGDIFVADTGNKRIVEFDSQGNSITQFGSAGLDPGQLDEPVGITLDAAGRVYVADTWNQRVQVFTPDSTGKNYTSTLTFDINGWFGQSLDNKPFIAVDQAGNIYVTDPEGYRVLEFTPDGKIIRGWGDTGDPTDTLGLPSGIAIDAQGHVWVSDAGNNRIMRFTMPGQ